MQGYPKAVSLSTYVVMIYDLGIAEGKSALHYLLSLKGFL